MMLSEHVNGPEHSGNSRYRSFFTMGTVGVVCLGLMGCPGKGDNLQPEADAGENVTAELGDLVQLDGSDSSDEDEDDVLTYSWSIAEAPTGSAATLDDDTAVDPSFTPDVPGLYEIELTVDDGQGADNSTDADTVLVTVEDVPPPREPYIFLIFGRFAYDDLTDSAIPYVFDGGAPIPPTIEIQVFTQAGWESESPPPEEFCSIFIQGDGTPIPLTTWSYNDDGTDLNHQGFVFDAGATFTVDSDCDDGADGGFGDPEVWGDSLVDALMAYDWGFGVGAFRPDIEQILQDSPDFQYFAGTTMFIGQAGTPLLQTSNGFCNAAAIDAENNVLLDGDGNPQQILGADITAEGVLPRGVYLMSPAFGYITDIFLQ